MNRTTMDGKSNRIFNNGGIRTNVVHGTGHPVQSQEDLKRIMDRARARARKIWCDREGCRHLRSVKP